MATRRGAQVLEEFLRDHDDEFFCIGTIRFV
jgi:hypothetical protein